jgi:hypothetical protein
MKNQKSGTLAGKIGNTAAMEVRSLYQGCAAGSSRTGGRCSAKRAQSRAAGRAQSGKLQ